MVVARCCQNFNDVIANLDDGNIECAATQVVHHNLLGRAVVQTVRQRSTRGFINNTQYIQAGNTTCIFGCLTLRIVEISRYRDNGIGNIPTQILLGISAHFTQDHGRDFLGSERLPVHAGFPLTTHMALNRRNCSVGIYRCLPLSDATHQAFAFFRKGHYARRGSLPFRIGDNGYAAALHSCHAAIGGTEIDSYCRTHMGPPYLFTSSVKSRENKCISQPNGLNFSEPCWMLGPSPIARSAPYQFLLHSLSAQQRKKRSPSGASAPMASLLAC